MGDFLYKVKAVVDKASFQEGIRELEKLEQTGKRLIKGIAGVGGAAITSATIVGEVAQQELKVAKAIGTSTEALSGWKIACNVAGASASGLIGTLSALENKMQHIKTGTIDSALAKNLGLLGIGYGDFADMDSESRMRTVFNQADQMEDQKLAATLVGDILGQAGREYYDSLKLSGRSLESQLAEAKKLNFVSETNRKEAAVFAAEMRSVKEAGKSISMLFGAEIGAALTPTVRRVKNYLIENRETIRKGIEGFAQNIGGVFNAIAGVIGKVAPLIEGLIDKFGGLDKIIVKVGVGFASMKLVQVAGGIKSLITGVNLLKAAMGGIGKGLLGAGLYLLIDDLVGHFQGKKSGIYDIIIPALKELKKEFNLDINTDKFNELAKTLKELWQNTEDFRKALALIGEISIATALDAITKSINGLASAVTFALQLFNAFIEGGFTGGVDFIMQSINDAKNSDDHPILEWAGSAAKITDVIVNPKKYLLELGISGAAALQGRKKDKADDSANDAIVSPSGKITKLSPEDWVFALKDIKDLAGAFLPAGLTTNNNMNAPANYVINQTLNVGAGARAQEVKASAYKGTADALQNSLNNASRIMQLMPGTR